ncbi:Beta-glucosidase A [Tetrabaena socialis]|uniref:Beta-glucosidase A n=1 Tax=Tetrabaena socialis TaxID=47790 RepID=A0A2J8AHV1_9CHLO|nr:Beta-glucosidase A [Tetrabaena socialis]|eukprot:PNH12081.1 Beta-glucosidase A [Tetrabaena socialis]
MNGHVGDAPAEGEEPIRFLKGAAISVWQNSGDAGSNWTRFAKSRWPFRYFGVSAIRGKYNIDKCSDFWNNYERDIKLAADIGSTTFRFSIEWARIEPEAGVIDMEAVRRYHQMIDCMIANKLEPNATLWHFVHPLWFEDAGGFTREENIPAFVAFSKRCFGWFGSKIRLWATFNEPTCYLFLGWVVGIAPPGRIFDLVGAGRMLSTMLKAHVAAYHAIKAMPGGDKAQVGLVSHHITFEAQGTGILHGVAKLMSDWMTYWWGWDVMEHWMLTGEFIWKLPVLGVWQRWRDPAGRPPCDWWGINYYSRGIFSWYLCPSCRHAEVMTDMYYPIYPEGMYQAIKRCGGGAARGACTRLSRETGIADSRDDRRAVMIDAYFKEVLRAVADGYDVRGFYYWTLIDNLEWATGYTMKFGLYAWEPDGSVDRKLKEGSKTLVRYFRTLPDDLAGVREAARKAQAVLGRDLGVEAELEQEGFVRMGSEGLMAPKGTAGTCKKGVGMMAIG